MNNTFLKLDEHIRTQASSILGSITAETDISKHSTTDPDILMNVLNDQKVKRDIKAFKDELVYYGLSANVSNLNIIILALRLGLRIGAYYEIEDYKKNEYVYMD